MASSTRPMSNCPPMVLLTPISTLSKSMKTAMRVLRVSVTIIYIPPGRGSGPGGWRIEDWSKGRIPGDFGRRGQAAQLQRTPQYSRRLPQSLDESCHGRPVGFLGDIEEIVVIGPGNGGECLGARHPFEELPAEREGNNRVRLAVHHEHRLLKPPQQLDRREAVGPEQIEDSQHRLPANDRCFVGKSTFEHESFRRDHAGR